MTNRTPGVLALLLVFLWASLMAVASTGCRESKPSLAPADHSYTVRARVIAMPAAGAYLQLHHAEIPEFKNQAGAVVGMKEMVMEFADLSKDAAATVDSLSPGDGVEVTFEVRWTSDPRMLVTRVRKLEPAAELGLKKKLGAEEQK